MKTIKREKFSNRIFVGITGWKEKHWKDKIKEIEKFKITAVSLFLEQFKKRQREKIYKSLLASSIKKIPLVHIRGDMEKEELVFLAKNFGSSYFTIHEDEFKVMKKWAGFYKNLFLEMNVDSFVSRAVKVNKIGGFCIDLSHFKIEKEKWSKEFEYILKRRNTHRYFACNHLNGYSPSKNSDMHTVKSLKDFDYLTTLPKFLFGKIIAIEAYNSISEQLKFKRYLSRLLDSRFSS